MPDREPSTLWGRLIALPVDSTPKTIFVAVTLCLFCSMIVAFAAVNLRPIQVYNKALDKKVNILQVAGLYNCLLYTSPSPRDLSTSRMPSSA